MSGRLVLNGINGANSLGFLAAIGCLAVGSGTWNALTLRWERHFGAWRPVLGRCVEDPELFLDRLLLELKSADLSSFAVDKRLPFSAAAFRSALEDAQRLAFVGNRRASDILCSLGDENYPEEETFQDTALRMVRSGDAAGQGFLAYAHEIRHTVNRSEVRRALFNAWDYKDHGFSLRWDPIEDQSYALRADNPAKSTDKNSPGAMNAANALALEAIPLFPVFCMGRRAKTTGFLEDGKRRCFSWPIWSVDLDLETVRSLLSASCLQSPLPDAKLRKEWENMGIAAVFRAAVVAPNKYYKNFTPAVPV